MQEVQQSCGERRVFVIEDNSLLVNFYRSVFGGLGCSVIHAKSREQALRMFGDSRPDLFIVDDRLPDGTGIDATREIRSHDGFGEVPIIATVSRPSREVTGRLESAGISSVVTKPLDVRAFSALVKRYLPAPRLLSEPIGIDGPA